MAGPSQARPAQYLPPEEASARDLQCRVGNAVSARLQSASLPSESQVLASSRINRVAFVREEGLNLREGPDQKSRSLAKLAFGQRVHVLDEQPGWEEVAVLGQMGYVSAPRIHFPPDSLLKKDPGLRLIRVRPGQTFWGLVKEMYGIQGNEGTPDQNINHFINAIRAVNKAEAFEVKTDILDDLGNAIISGRDASDTYLKAGVNLWIPSFTVAAAMDVGSGTVTGEVARLVKKIEQKIDDFIEACKASWKYIPGAIAHYAGEMAESLLSGLIEFAKDAAKILVASTAAGALIGALLGGGAGAIPGAEAGFEIGLLILEYYGLYQLVKAVLEVAGNLVAKLGEFIKLVWTANGDRKQIDQAGRTLADALGILVAAALVAVVAYLLKKGGKALSESKFAKTVGETRLAQWFNERQKLTTSKELLEKGKEPAPGAAKFVPKVGDNLETLMGDSTLTPSQTTVTLEVAQRYAAEMSAGRWNWNHPTDKIILDPKGNIMSGHHRVVAAKLAGIPIPESGIYRSSTLQIPEKVRTWSDVTFE